MPTYNGYPSWNAWNVSLWLNNDEGMYHWMRDLVIRLGRKPAARILTEQLKGEKTPDGAKYNHRSIYLAMEGLDEK